MLIRRVPPAWPNFADDAESAERHGYWYSRGEAASTFGQYDTVTVCHLSADPHISANAREYEHAGISLAAAGLASCENIRASLELLAHIAPAAASRRSHTDIGAPSDATAASRTLRRAESVEELRAALSATEERSRTPTPLNWPPTHSRSLPRLAVGLGASPPVSRAPSSSPTVAPRRRSLGQRAEARRALQLGCGDGGEAAQRGVSGVATALVASDEAVTPPSPPHPHHTPQHTTTHHHTPPPPHTPTHHHHPPTPTPTRHRKEAEHSPSPAWASNHPAPRPPARLPYPDLPFQISLVRPPPTLPSPLPGPASTPPLCPTTGAGGAAACGVCGDFVVAGGG